MSIESITAICAELELPRHPAPGIMSGRYVDHHQVVGTVSRSAISRLREAIEKAYASNASDMLEHIYDHRDAVRDLLVSCVFFLHISNESYPELRDRAYQLARSIRRSQRIDVMPLVGLLADIDRAAEAEYRRLANARGFVVV